MMKLMPGADVLRADSAGSSFWQFPQTFLLINETTYLAADIGLDDTVVEIGAESFLEDSLVYIGPELVMITGRDGLMCTVTRDLNGRRRSHIAGTPIVCAYDYSDVSVQVEDVEGSSEVDWISLALTWDGLNTATPGAPLVFPEPKIHNIPFQFWCRATCPAPDTGAPEARTDLRLRIDGTRIELI